MTNAYLGIDIGTTAIKAALFSADGAVIGDGIAEYRLETPTPDIVELDPELYWQATQTALQGALANAAGCAIRALAITGQCETLICVDQAGRPLRKAIVWLDNRATAEAAELTAAFGSAPLFRLSGQTEMLPCWPAPKILWLQKHDPTTYAACAKYLMVEDFIAYRLTGEYATCRGLLPSTLYYDIRTGDYDDAMLAAIGISRRQLPALRDPGEIIGLCRAVLPGIPAGTPVAAAPMDHICGALGSGCCEPGVVSATTGCALALCVPTPALLYDDALRISTYHGFTPQSYAMLPWAPTAGMILKHFRDEFCRDWSYADFDRAAATIAPGADGLVLLPHCAGAVSPVCNPAARGVAYGVTLAHSRGHWSRAIMESIAFLLKDNVLAVADLGCPIRELRVLGGAARSPLWLQIKADVLNLPITTTQCPEATALGAAMLAAKAAGDVATPAAAAAAMVRTAQVIQPGPDAERYPAIFNKYQALNQLLLPTFGDGEKS